MTKSSFKLVLSILLVLISNNAFAQYVTPPLNPLTLASSPSALVSSNRHPVILSGLAFNGLFTQLVQLGTLGSGGQALIPGAYDPALSAFLLSFGFSTAPTNQVELFQKANYSKATYQDFQAAIKFNFDDLHIQLNTDNKTLEVTALNSDVTKEVKTDTAIRAAYLLGNFSAGLGYALTRTKGGITSSSSLTEKNIELSSTFRFLDRYFISALANTGLSESTDEPGNKWNSGGIGFAFERSTASLTLLRLEFFFRLNQEAIVEAADPAGTSSIHRGGYDHSSSLEFQIANFVVSYQLTTYKGNETEANGVKYPEVIRWKSLAGVTVSAVGNFSKTTIQFEQNTLSNSKGEANTTKIYRVLQGFAF